VSHYPVARSPLARLADWRERLCPGRLIPSGGRPAPAHAEGRPERADLRRVSPSPDIYATKQLLGHVDVSTTANIYVQGPSADLEEKLRKAWGE
jgi:hypothetical protein